MHNFALAHIEEITGKVRFFKLVIDGFCAFDEFEKQIRREGNLAAQLNSIQTRMH